MAHIHGARGDAVDPYLQLCNLNVYWMRNYLRRIEPRPGVAHLNLMNYTVAFRAYERVNIIRQRIQTSDSEPLTGDGLAYDENDEHALDLRNQNHDADPYVKLADLLTGLEYPLSLDDPVYIQMCGMTDYKRLQFIRRSKKTIEGPLPDITYKMDYEHARIMDMSTQLSYIRYRLKVPNGQPLKKDGTGWSPADIPPGAIVGDPNGPGDRPKREIFQYPTSLFHRTLPDPTNAVYVRYIRMTGGELDQAIADQSEKIDEEGNYFQEYIDAYVVYCCVMHYRERNFTPVGEALHPYDESDYVPDPYDDVYREYCNYTMAELQELRLIAERGIENQLDLDDDRDRFDIEHVHNLSVIKYIVTIRLVLNVPFYSRLMNNGLAYGIAVERAADEDMVDDSRVARRRAPPITRSRTRQLIESSKPVSSNTRQRSLRGFADDTTQAKTAVLSDGVQMDNVDDLSASMGSMSVRRRQR